MGLVVAVALASSPTVPAAPLPTMVEWVTVTLTPVLPLNAEPSSALMPISAEPPGTVSIAVSSMVNATLVPPAGPLLFVSTACVARIRSRRSVRAETTPREATIVESWTAPPGAMKELTPTVLVPGPVGRITLPSSNVAPSSMTPVPVVVPGGAVTATRSPFR